MADLIDMLLPASFRGFPLYIDEDSSSFGRRIVTDVFPGQDQPSQNDLGAAPQTFSVTAVIVGSSFILQATALEALLKVPGPGILIHPHYGPLNVVVKDVQRKHNFETIGEVAFTITFEQYGSSLFPSNATDTLAGLVTGATNLLASLGIDFAVAAVLVDVATFVLSDALARGNLFLTMTQTALSSSGLTPYAPPVTPLAAVTSTTAATVTALFQSIGAAAAPVVTPVIGAAAPAAATTTTTDTAGTTATAAMTGAQVTTLMQTLSNLATQTIADTEPTITAPGSTRAANADALDNLFRGSAIAAMTIAAQYAVYDSTEQALALRAQMAASIEALRDKFGADGWFNSWIACGEALAAITRDINDRIGRLPRTVTIKTQSVRPALELANRLYGDDPTVIFSQSDDIVARNAISNPGTVPAQEMEVLIDAS